MKRLLILAVFSAIMYANTPGQNLKLKWVDEQVEAIKPNRVGLSAHATSMLKNPFLTQLRINRMKDKKPEDEKQKSSAEPSKVVTYAEASEPMDTVDEPEGRKPLHLQTVINKTRVLIDGKWYAVNDKVYGYQIKKIDAASVLLKSKKKELKLFIATNNSKIKIQTK